MSLNFIMNLLNGYDEKLGFVKTFYEFAENNVFFVKKNELFL